MSKHIVIAQCQFFSLSHQIEPIEIKKNFIEILGPWSMFCFFAWSTENAMSIDTTGPKIIGSYQVFFDKKNFKLVIMIVDSDNWIRKSLWFSRVFEQEVDYRWTLFSDPAMPIWMQNCLNKNSNTFVCYDFFKTLRVCVCVFICLLFLNVLFPNIHRFNIKTHKIKTIKKDGKIE